MQRDRVQRVEVEHAAGVRESVLPLLLLGQRRQFPRRRLVVDPGRSQPNRQRQQAAVAVGQPQHMAAAEPMLGAGPGPQVHPGAGREIALHRRDVVRAVGAPLPAQRPGVRVLRRPRHHGDLVSDEEAREQADAELADVVPVSRQLTPLGTATDGRQQLHQLGAGQADAVVGDDHLRRPVAGLHHVDLDSAGNARLEPPAGRDGVHRVLQQLPDVYVRAAVEVPGQQGDQAAQIHLERSGHGRVRGTHAAILGWRTTP
ncbi:hypothetical protein GCM10018954_082100 [Kutzneria kofuensis]